MPCVASPHDNTPDAKQALLNRYLASKLRSTSGSTFLRKGPATRHCPSSAIPRAPRPDRRSRRAAQSQVLSPPDLVVPLQQLSEEAYARALRSHDDPEPRPTTLAHDHLWCGSEPDVDDTFSLWDGSLGYVPKEAIYDALQRFENGDYIGRMSAEPKTALVHVVAEEMLQRRISVTHSSLVQLQNFLAGSYQLMVIRDPRLALSHRDHWLLGSLRDRTQELQWLKHQAELRWWKRSGKKIEEIKQQLTEPSESEINAMFESYTHHAEPSSS